jgi:hypothetical protein
LAKAYSRSVLIAARMMLSLPARRKSNSCTAAIPSCCQPLGEDPVAR